MRKFIVYIGLLFFFSSGTLYYTSEYKSYSRAILLGGIILIFLSNRIVNRYVYFRISLLPGAYYIFSFSILFALFDNLEFGIFVSSIGMILIGLTAFKWIPNAMMKSGLQYNNLLILLLIFHTIIFVTSFIKYGFFISYYEGLFTNPNGFGGAAATFCAIVCMTYLYYLYESGISLIGNIVFVLLLGSSAFFSLISNSRASFTVVMIEITVFLLIIMKTIFKGSRSVFKKNMSIALFVFFIAMVIVICFTDAYQLIQDNIIHKFNSYAESGDIWNGRQEKWTAIFERLKFFGNGEYADMGAHNTYLSMLDQYGVIPFVSLCMFALGGLIESIKRVFFSNDTTSKDFIPLFSFLLFATRGFSEGIMLSTATLLMILSVNILESSESRVIL